MHTVRRTCKALPRIITKVRRGARQLHFQDGSLRHLCTGQTEDKHMSDSSKNIAQTKKEQRWCYDPTIKYEALRQCAVPRFAYYDDSATDWTGSDSEIEIETMTEEEVQTRKEKILAEGKEEQPFKYHPGFSYEVLKQFFYLDSPDSISSSSLMLYSDTKEDMKSKVHKYRSMVRQAITSSDFNCETDTETEINRKDNILRRTKDEQLFTYDPSIEYKPLKRYIVPRFDFFDSSSTDWSDSYSETETETETVEVEEAESQQGKILPGKTALSRRLG